MVILSLCVYETSNQALDHRQSTVKMGVQNEPRGSSIRDPKAQYAASVHRHGRMNPPTWPIQRPITASFDFGVRLVNFVFRLTRVAVFTYSSFSFFMLPRQLLFCSTFCHGYDG